MSTIRSFPIAVLKRFDDALKTTKNVVVIMAKKLDEQHIEGAARDGILCRTSSYDFYNASSFDFNKLIADPDEQSKIVSYLHQRCAQIDRLLAIKQQKIEKLTQYKASMIYEYVTRKKK